ncbi:LysM peptidoglycan-binding domain-containing protein [Heyndrickxia sporothermodurans]
MYYKERSLNNIEKLAPNTRYLAKKWFDYCEKNNIEILVYETIRTEAQQREYVNKGASQTMKSYHLVGQALDFVPTKGKETLWNGYGTKDIQKAINYAKSLGFEWGGDWKGFVDKPHLEYNYKGYGTDKTLTIGSNDKPTTSTNPVVIDEKYKVLKTISGYGTAADAKAGKNPKTKVTADTYYVYNRSNGMINVTKKKGVPGSWINPNETVKENSNAKPTYYTVKKGDTVSALALKFGSTQAQIKAWNKLNSKYLIKIGQKLRVK